MALQGQTDHKNFPLVTSGRTLVRSAQIILTDAGRSTVLKRGTVMAQVAASGKWVPFTDETATDGTGTARGILYSDDVAAAAIAAADVTDNVIIVAGFPATIDSQQIVIENSKTVATVIGATTVNARTVRDDLARIGLFVETTLDVTLLEA